MNKSFWDVVAIWAKCVKSLGFVQGTYYAFLFRLKDKKAFTIQPDFIRNPIYLRENSSDLSVFREVFIDKCYEAPGLPTHVKTIIDCGGNIGLTSVFFSNKYPTSVIYTVEPDSNNFAQLKLNTSDYPNIHGIQSGIWYRGAFLKIVNETSGNSSFIIAESETPTSIQATTLSQIVSKYNIKSIDLLKMDIESTEFYIFKHDSLDWLDITQYFIIETHDFFINGCNQLLFNVMFEKGFLLEMTYGQSFFFKRIATSVKK